MKNKSNKKKLPRYNIGYSPLGLGSRKPRTLGYQPNLGIGNVHFELTLGEDITPEVNAMRANQVPKALAKLSLNATYPIQALLNLKTVPIFTPISNAIANSAALSFGLGVLLSGGSLIGSLSNTISNINKIGKAGNFTNGAALIGTKTVLNTTGNILGGLGTAYGLYNVGSDIANAGEHRTAGDMLKTRNKTTVTTAEGNQYDEYSGINGNAEMEYERQNRTAKQIGLTTDAMGLGASVGSFFGPLGMGIGAAGGLVLGGLASLFGFGDNSDEIELELNNASDLTTRLNRQSRSSALSEDAKSAFYNRAANGKQPIWTPAGLVNGKATARVSNGELIGNFEDGYISRVPGKKNNKDTKFAALKDSDFVISNKHGLSDYAATTGDYIGALMIQDLIMNKKYKNGKLPGFVNGWADYALTALPHLGSSMINLAEYNRARNANTYAPDTYVDNAEGRAAVNELAKLRFDATPYLTDAQRALNQANWNTRRNVGLGIGGRAVAQNANFAAYLDSLRKIRSLENDANAQYRQAYATALANLGATNQARRMDSNVRKATWEQQANAAKENYLAQYNLNMVMAGLNGAADLLRMKQYNQSLGIQNKMLDLYDRQAKTDELKANAYINSLGGNNTTTAASAGIPLSYMVNMTKTPLSKYAFAPGILEAINRTPTIKYKNGKMPKYEDGLVDTRSDTTYQGYNPNPIPWGAGLDAAGQGPLALLDGIEAASLVSNNPYLLTGIAPSPGKVTYTPEQMTKLWLKHGQEYARKNKLSTFMGPNGKMYAHMPDGKVRSFEAIGKEIRGEEPITYTAKKFKPVDHIIKKVPKVISTSKKTYNYGAITANDFK